jgi:hypothetical protein
MTLVNFLPSPYSSVRHVAAAIRRCLKKEGSLA